MNIFITGGTSGIGLELAILFLREGHTVGTCSFEDKKTVLPLLPEKLFYYQADVTNTEKMKEVINAFHFTTGKLDLVVANAGISMEKATIPDFDRGRKVIEINVLGVLNTFEPAIMIMKDQRAGHLAAIGSIAGTVGLPGTAIYGASKAAVINLCESLEIDLLSFGINVTTLAPGFINTPLTKDNKHKMPFIMSQEKAALFIKKGLEQKSGLYIFPFPMMLISRILYYLPRSVYKALMKLDLLNLRGKH